MCLLDPLRIGVLKLQADNTATSPLVLDVMQTAVATVEDTHPTTDPAMEFKHALLAYVEDPSHVVLGSALTGPFGPTALSWPTLMACPRKFWMAASWLAPDTLHWCKVGRRGVLLTEEDVERV